MAKAAARSIAADKDERLLESERLDIDGDVVVRSEGAGRVNLEAELGPEEAARLLAAIDEADAEYERGEVVDAEVVLEELRQILRG
jgi:hypothetical protein